MHHSGHSLMRISNLHLLLLDSVSFVFFLIFFYTVTTFYLSLAVLTFILLYNVLIV